MNNQLSSNKISIIKGTIDIYIYIDIQLFRDRCQRDKQIDRLSVREKDTDRYIHINILIYEQ